MFLFYFAFPCLQPGHGADFRFVCNCKLVCKFGNGAQCTCTATVVVVIGFPVASFSVQRTTPGRPGRLRGGCGAA